MILDNTAMCLNYKSIISLNSSTYVRSIATTQSSTELNNVNWGGSIIGKLNHTTPPSDYLLIKSSAELKNVNWGGSIISKEYHTTTPTTPTTTM